MIRSHVPCRFEIQPKGWLSKILVKLGLFHYKVKLQRQELLSSRR